MLNIVSALRAMYFSLRPCFPLYFEFQISYVRLNAIGGSPYTNITFILHGVTRAIQTVEVYGRQYVMVINRYYCNVATPYRPTAQADIIGPDSPSGARSEYLWGSYFPVLIVLLETPESRQKTRRMERYVLNIDSS